MPNLAAIGKAALKVGEELAPRVGKEAAEDIATSVPEKFIDPYTAIKEYQVSGRNINREIALSGGDLGKLSGVQYSPRVSHTQQPYSMSKLVEGIDNAMQPLEEDRVLYRGLSMSPQQVESLTQGKVFTAYSYMSTSKSQSVAESFTGSGAPGSDRASVVLEIIAGKGSVKGVDVNRAVGSSQFNEDEILLPRGQQFDIVSKRSVTDNYGATRQYITMKPKGSEMPLVYSRKATVHSGEQTVINLPLKDGATRPMVTIQKQQYLLPKIVSTPVEELEKKYPDVDVGKLKQMAEKQLKTME